MVPCSAKVAGVGCCGFACVVDGLEKVTSFKPWPLLAAMIDLWHVGCSH